MNLDAQQHNNSGASFAETALKLGGKSDDEARRTGAIDQADDQVETLFAQRFQTSHSPVHRAVWEQHVPLDLFRSLAPAVGEATNARITRAMETVRQHRAAGTLYDERGKIAEPVLAELGTHGYWGLLVDKAHGGSELPFATFAPILTRMATVDPTVAGLASVHGCIGAVDPVRTFGTPEQKQRFLPELASGAQLSAFALTEPGAGSDLTALKTTAHRDGDSFLINGEKLFITNAVPGRTIGLVVLLEGRPAVLIAQLPREEDEHFQIRRYGLHALKHTYNQGLVFRDFRVPAENLLTPPRGDGLTIAYHGLNLGRVALCATAAGSMRLLLASMLPWAQYRKTYGAAIATRELVQRRLARLAGLIVAADALVDWCSGLLDEGYRGEIECIVAKIFGSESLKEAAIELCMKTHGGRSFLHGHLFGDNVHEYLAPCIYEGEGEVLSLALFKSLVKQHGVTYFEPIGKALAAAGIRKPSPLNPAHAWALRGAVGPYLKWQLAQRLQSPSSLNLDGIAAPLKEHVEFAVRWLDAAPLRIDGVMRKHQLALADRQCRMAQLSGQIQDVVVLLVTALYAARSDNEVVRAAADSVCRDLTRRLTGRLASDRDFRLATKLGAQIADGGFGAVAGVDAAEILMPYGDG